MERPTFGVAGFPPNFTKSKYKKDKFNIFDWLIELGLDSIEFQCTYGFKTPDADLSKYKFLAEEKNKTITVHAPYFVNLGSKNEQVVESSIANMIKGIEFCKKIGATKLIFHPGGGWGKTESERREAIDRLIASLCEIENSTNMSGVKFYPEIGGKKNALGSLDEIIYICKHVKNAYPCIDIAHLHAREVGSMISSDKILEVLDRIETELGRDALMNTHFHVYPIEYTEMGEKVHRTYSDKDINGNLFRPYAEDFISAIIKKGINPSIICESHDAQDVDAIHIRDTYNNMVE